MDPSILGVIMVSGIVAIILIFIVQLVIPHWTGPLFKYLLRTQIAYATVVVLSIVLMILATGKECDMATIVEVGACNSRATCIVMTDRDTVERVDFPIKGGSIPISCKNVWRWWWQY